MRKCVIFGVCGGFFEDGEGFRGSFELGKVGNDGQIGGLFEDFIKIVGFVLNEEGFGREIFADNGQVGGEFVGDVGVVVITVDILEQAWD